MRNFTITFKSMIRDEMKTREFDQMDSVRQLLATVSPSTYVITDNKKGEEIEWYLNNSKVTKEEYHQEVKS